MKTDKQALTLALQLAITARTNKQSQDATAIAEQLAVRLTAQEVEICKKAALLSIHS